MLLTGISCSQKTVRPKNPDATLTLALRAGIYADVIKHCLPAFEVEHNVLCTVLELGEDDLHQRGVTRKQWRTYIAVADTFDELKRILSDI